MNDEVKCLECGSTQVHAEKRGWSLLTGMIGSGKIILTCLKCGHRFKPGKGAVATPRAPTPVFAIPQQQISSKILWLVGGGIALFVAMVGIIGYSPTESSIPTPPQIVRPSVPPPRFRIYKFRLDGPTVIVVPLNTTDEQLKSLLWLFREKVRSHQFKDVGIKQATANGYQSGMLVVYRGEKCANEGYVDTTPCGYGEHDDAVYQWGIDGDPNKDSGSISVNGNDTVVFDYKDDWQVAPEVLRDRRGSAQRQ